MIDSTIRIEAEGIALDGSSNRFRLKIVKMLASAKRGHVGPAFSICEIVSVIFEEFLNRDLMFKDDSSRNRFILSKGHGCLSLYVALAELGVIKDEELKSFCKFESRLGGHPEARLIPEVEFSTGALGHGLPLAAGLGLGLKLKKSPGKVFVLLGDGECNEGSVWEAALHIIKHQLDNVVIIIDFNGQQANGITRNVIDFTNMDELWSSFGFRVIQINGHDKSLIRKTLTNINHNIPTVIIAHTVKGKGVKAAENNPNWHHKSKIGEDDLAAFRTELGAV